MYFDHLEIIVTNQQSGYVVDLAEILKEEGRPLFEEDLPDRYQSLFNELESFPYPGQVIIKDKFLFLEFKNADEALIVAEDQLLESLRKMGLTAVAVFSLNAQEEWEDEEDCAKFYLLEGQRLSRLSVETVEQRTDMELDGGYSNSEEILWRLVANANL